MNNIISSVLQTMDEQSSRISSIFNKELEDKELKEIANALGAKPLQVPITYVNMGQFHILLELFKTDWLFSTLRLFYFLCDDPTVVEDGDITDANEINEYFFGDGIFDESVYKDHIKKFINSFNQPVIYTFDYHKDSYIMYIDTKDMYISILMYEYETKLAHDDVGIRLNTEDYAKLPQAVKVALTRVYNAYNSHDGFKSFKWHNEDFFTEYKDISQETSKKLTFLVKAAEGSTNEKPLDIVEFDKNWVEFTIASVNEKYEKLKPQLLECSNKINTTFRKLGFYPVDVNKAKRGVDWVIRKDYLNALSSLIKLDYIKLGDLFTSFIAMCSVLEWFVKSSDVILYDINSVQVSADDEVVFFDDESLLISGESLQRLINTVNDVKTFITLYNGKEYAIIIDKQNNCVDVIVRYKQYLLTGDTEFVMRRQILSPTDLDTIISDGYTIRLDDYVVLNTVIGAYKNYVQYLQKSVDVVCINRSGTKTISNVATNANADSEPLLVKYIDTNAPKRRTVYTGKGTPHSHHRSPQEHIRHIKERVLNDGTVIPARNIIVNKGVKYGNTVITVYKN